MTVTNDHTFVVITIRFCPHSLHITVFVTRTTQRVPLVGAGTAYPSEAHDYAPCFCSVCVAQSLVFCIIFCIFCLFSFGRCIVCSSSIYGFWMSLWPFQTFLVLLSFLYFGHCFVCPLIYGFSLLIRYLQAFLKVTISRNAMSAHWWYYSYDSHLWLLINPLVSSNCSSNIMYGRLFWHNKGLCNYKNIRNIFKHTGSTIVQLTSK